MAMAKKTVGQQYDLLQSYSSRCSRAVRLAAACVVIFFFTIHTSSTCICGAVLSALQLGSALRQALCHQSPLQTARQRTLAKQEGWRALVLLLLSLRLSKPSSCTAAGKGCARRATCDHMDVGRLCVDAWNTSIDRLRLPA